MESHSSILAWEIPWTKEPGGLRSMGLQRVGHDRVTEHAHAHTHVHTHTMYLFAHRRKIQEMPPMSPTKISRTRLVFLNFGTIDILRHIILYRKETSYLLKDFP